MIRTPFLIDRFVRSRSRKGQGSTEIDFAWLAPLACIAVILFISWIFTGWIVELRDNRIASDDRTCVQAFGEGWDHQLVDVEELERKGNKIPDSAKDNSDYAACVKDKEAKLVPV